MAKVISSIKGVASSAKRKTKEAAEATKLKVDIKVEESNLDHCFEKLGRAVYANSRTGKNGSRVSKLIKEADAICQLIEEYKNRLAVLQKKEVCPHCGAVIKAGAPCRNCKEKIVKTPKKANPVDENQNSVKENAEANSAKKEKNE